MIYSGYVVSFLRCSASPREKASAFGQHYTITCATAQGYYIDTLLVNRLLALVGVSE